MGVPYALREFYPENALVQGLFGGMRLVVYWVILAVCGWRFDQWLNKRMREKGKAR